MEHLFSPADHIVKVFEYPGYVDYIGTSFLDYPNLRNRQVYLQAETAYISEARHTANPGQNDMPFFATWLFSSLLQEILGRDHENIKQPSLFRHADFIRPTWTISGDRQNLVFHTAKLMPLLETWSASVSTIIPDSQDYYEHLKRCLNIAHNVLHWPSVEIQPEVKSILASVGDLLSVAIDLTFRNAAYYNINDKCPFVWPTSTLIDEFMPKASSAGWCPSEVAILPLGDGPFYPTIHFYLSCTRALSDGIYNNCPSFRKIPGSHPKQMHSGCTEALCQSNNSNANPPHHRQPYCSCGSFRFKESTWQQLLHIIDIGIPLLKCRIVGPEARLEISVVPYQPGLRYVAISHVWSHGLGNPEANEVLNCRFEFMVRSVMECWNVKGQKCDEVLLWFDTLCCPISPVESKNNVLGSMRDVYMQAEYTLVLDGELTKLDTTNRTNLEVGLRILTSDWMRRLWTLQEGLLPREVWVKFKNILFPLDSLDEIDPFKVPFNQYRVAKYVKHLLYSVRKSLATKETLALRSWPLIEGAVRQRKVTVATDEALCLSTLMDLDIALISNTDPPDRMMALWKEINVSEFGIPRGVIFEAGPKLTTQGFRWAPVSLLNKRSGSPYALDTQRVTLKEDGLLVHNQGIFLTHGRVSIAFKLHLDRNNPGFGAAQRSTKVEYIRDQHGSWFSLIREDLGDIDQTVADLILSNPEGKYAVIFSSNVHKVHIVQSGTRVGETQHVSIVRPITFGKQHGPAFEFAYQIARRLAASSEFEVLNYGEMFSKIGEAAEESISTPEARSLYSSQGFEHKKFQMLVLVNTMLILAGYGFLEGHTVPETQEWCYT